jgi:Holliday junction resolvase RusA-like endonuclease
VSAETTIRRVLVPGVPDAVLSPNASWGVHWGTKARARNRLGKAAWAAALQARPEVPISEPVKVTARICWPSRRQIMDDDNAAACLKRMWDAFTQAGMWEDDRLMRLQPIQQEKLDKEGLLTWPGGVIVVDIEEVS